MVSSSSGLCHPLFQLHPRLCPLRQVSKTSTSGLVLLAVHRSLMHAFSFASFFNVEKAQLRPVSAVEIHYTQAGGITGHVMLLCMLLMYTTAHHRIRQQSYEAFWYTHHLFIPFLLAMYTHAVGCFVRDSTQPYSPFAGAIFWKHCIGYHGWRWELWGVLSTCANGSTGKFEVDVGRRFYGSFDILMVSCVLLSVFLFFPPFSCLIFYRLFHCDEMIL